MGKSSLGLGRVGCRAAQQATVGTRQRSKALDLPEQPLPSGTQPRHILPFIPRPPVMNEHRNGVFRAFWVPDLC